MDIPALSEALIKRICDHHKANHCHITNDAIERLMDYDFPGNVRELMNILRQAVALSPDNVITSEHIRLDNHRAREHASAAVLIPAPTHPLYPESAAIDTETDLPRSLADAEARHIANLLQFYNNDRHAVAEALGVSERTLYRKIKRYHLTVPAAVERYISDT